MQKTLDRIPGFRTAAALLLIVLLVFSPSLFAYFTARDLPAAVPAKGVFYTIEKIDRSPEPGVTKFQVKSPHAIYEVEGFLSLVKLLHEIEVIERIKKNDKGSSFFDGAAASVEATGTGLKNLAVHPVDSVKGVGKAIGKLGRGVGGMFRSKEEGEKASFGEKVLGGNERELAKEFKVDVYTTNPYLKSLLQQMAKARLGGKGAVAVIQFLIPIAAVASIALTAGSLNDAADQLVNDSSRGDLYRLNKEGLVAAGIREEDAKKVLDSPRLTPREQTYLRFYTEKLKYAPGYHEIFYSVFNSRSDWEARKKLYEAQMAANSDKGGLLKIQSFPEGIALHGKEGKIIFVTAHDDLELTKDGRAVLGRCGELSAAAGFPVEIWNGGKIEQDFIKEAQKKKIKTRAWIYLLGDKANENV